MSDDPYRFSSASDDDDDHSSDYTDATESDAGEHGNAGLGDMPAEVAIRYSLFLQRVKETAELANERMAERYPESYGEVAQTLYFLYMAAHHSVMENAQWVEDTHAALTNWPDEPVDLFKEVQQRWEGQRKTFQSQREAAAASGNPVPQETLPRFEHDARVSFHERGLVCVAPKLDDATLKTALQTLPQVITLVMRGVAMRCQLCNPMAIPGNPGSGYCCDMCNNGDMFVGYQAVFEEGQRSTVMLYENCQGFDVCVACGIFYSRLAQNEVRGYLRAAKVPPRPMIRTFAGRSSVMVHSAPVVSDGSVNLTVGIAPRGTHVIAWFVPASQVGCVDDGGIPPDWRSNTSISLIHRQEGSSANLDSELGACMICLDDMTIAEGNCLQTRCGHWFHAHCINEALRCATDGAPVCPLCREPNPMAEDECVEDLLKKNAYSVSVALPDGCDGAGEIVVGSLLSVDGVVGNETDIGALQRLPLCTPV